MKYTYTLIIVLLSIATFSQSSDILLNGIVSAENNQIKNVLNPTDSGDAVNLGYLNETLDTYQNQIDDLQSQLNNLQLQLQQVVDQDGNSYSYLFYGNQAWTVENAQMITYRDGTPIPQLTDQGEWANTTTGAWCYFDNDPSNGILYNWYAVAGIHDNDPDTPNKELAPEGWHVASYSEWEELQSFLIDAGYNFDETTNGNKIAKAMASTTGWLENSTDELDIGLGDPGYDQISNNSSSFNAYPTGGRRYNNSNFFNQGIESGYWSLSESTEVEGQSWQFHFYTDGVYTGMLEWYKNMGWSVRFVKD
jgi:uncharacterized protein (TIGR02145 family)